MITLRRFRRLEQAICEAGYAEDISWSEALGPPEDAEAFGRAAAYVIINSGMKNEVAELIYAKCLKAIERGRSVTKVYGHYAKARAIDAIWQNRLRHFGTFVATDDKLAFCHALPWIGPVTQYHLAKDLGVDVAKPDVHLARLAVRDRTTVERMCKRLSKQSGYRVATIDTILWRACATGILNSRRYEAAGWRLAFRGKPKD